MFLLVFALLLLLRLFPSWLLGLLVVVDLLLALTMLLVFIPILRLTFLAAISPSGVFGTSSTTKKLFFVLQLETAWIVAAVSQFRLLVSELAHKVVLHQ